MAEEDLDKALKRAEKLIRYRLRSKWELRTRLLDAGFEEATVEKVVFELEKKGILDDERFSKLYVDKKGNTG